MKICMLALRTDREAGAERIVFQIEEKLKNFYRVDLCAINRTSRALRRRVRGPFAMLFGRYDLIHSHLFLPGLLIRVRRFFDRSFRWVHTVHYCSYQGQSAGKIKRFLDEKWVFPAVDELVAVSAPTFDFIRQHPNSRLIENGMTLTEKRLPGHPLASRLTLGTVSMLRPEKGLASLIEAMPRILEQYPTARLRIAGEGPEREKLEKLIRSKGLQSHVRLVGYVNNVDNFLSSLDIFISAPHTESFGMAFLEAMQYSLPIVGTDVGAIPGLFQFGAFGQVISRRSDLSGEIANSVNSILSDLLSAQEKSHAGLVYYRERLDTGVMVDKYRETYQKLLVPGVCMVSPVVTHATGGLQRQIKIQSRELARLGIKPYILQRFDPGLSESAPEWSHATFLSTPNLFSEPQTPFWSRIRGFVFIVAGGFKIFQNRRNINFIHAHQLFSPTLLGVIAKQLFKKKLVVKVTASGELGEFNELKRLPFFRLRKWAFTYIDCVIVLSQEMRTEMLELGFPDEKIRLITNGVEVPAASRLSQPFHFKENGYFNLLYCGRLSREKSLHTIIEAAVHLKERGIPCKVHFVGGTYGGRDVTVELQLLAERFAHKVSVEFYGPQKDVAPYYLSCDAFILPSISEGMSNALLEALSYGIPCVASRIVPNEALIQDNLNGFLFDVGNERDLADKLELLANDQKESGAKLSLQLGEHARETMQRQFSSQHIGSQLKELYLALEEGGSHANWSERLA